MGNTGERAPSFARAHRDSGVSRAVPAAAGWSERALEHERRLRFLTDNVPTVMLYQLLIEPSGERRFLYVSAGVERLHGLTSEQVLANGSLIYEQVNEQDRARLRDAEERSGRDGTAFEMELRSISQHGQRWMLLRSAPRAPEGGAGWVRGEDDLTAGKRQQ